MLFIVGLPRSGTTWLAKIFDSHPETFYLHEPDGQIQAEACPLPVFCPGAEVESRLAEARAHTRVLCSLRTAKAVGSRPQFAKSYRHPAAALVRRGVVGMVKGIEHLTALSRGLQRLRVPDLASGPGITAGHTVIKSVRMLGRLNLLLAASPGSRAIVIVRHPCGHVASVLRGVRLGKFGHQRPAGEDPAVWEVLAATAQAVRRGLAADMFAALRPAERLAWRWAITNEKALDDAAAGYPIRFVRYEDLCLDPERVARELMAFAGLSWHPATDAFLTATSAADGRGRYYGLVHNPRQSAFKWKDELAADDVARILAVAARSRPGSLFPLA